MQTCYECVSIAGKGFENSSFLYNLECTTSQYFSCVTFFSPYIRSQTRQPLDATIQQFSRASLRMPSWFSFTKLLLFQGCTTSFPLFVVFSETPVYATFRSVFSEAHFPDSLFCSHHFLFYFFASEVWHKRVTSAPQL